MSQILGMDSFSLKGNYNTTQTNKKTDTARNTIGNPKLSESASSYYETLKEKYNDVEFVLVDDAHTENAKELASNYNSNKSMIVLISEDEVEQMATDEATRTQNEKLIEDAKAAMPDLMKQMKEAGVEVKSFGMEFNDDGTASYFAVVDKSMAAQKERIEKNLAEKREEKKTEEKNHKKEDLTTVTASSMEELIKKLKDSLYEAKTQSIMTEQEKMVGQHFDLKF